MLENVPLVGSMATGFGDNTIATPTQKTPNLKEASEQFVSMLYAYMFQQMRESGGDEENGLFSGDHANMMMGFLDQEMGKKMAGAEGSGLANALYRQLQQQTGDSSEAATAGEGADIAALAKASSKIPSMTGVDATLRSLDQVDADGNAIHEEEADPMFSSSAASMAMMRPLNAESGFTPLTLGNISQPMGFDDAEEEDSSQQMLNELYKLNQP